ncbi:class I SAM-dependent methyltransferase [Vibrio sp. T187]|uniref:class I SAM-dependent methyltransferase n=1 Tax=Vibrio TaxID=662 RepID=UPI0010C9868F|nr:MULTISPECIES: class I SAM-dependent methyltransferase [Vibrio]MBW3695374.1 class I SAM-dependent methyltransferase [Vibrio sp. T187]
MKSDMYSKHAEKYDAAIQNNIFNAHLERPSLQALLAPLSGKDVLDLGCGSGVYAQYLVEQGANKVTCLDFSESMVELVKTKLGDKVTAYSQDLAMGLPNEANDSADVIICPLVLHYIEDLNAVFKEVHRVLKVGGYMAFSMHHPFVDFECSISGNYFERELVTEEWDTVGEPVEVTFYRRSLTEIMNAMTDNGLVVTQLSEGKISEEAKALSQEHYERLSKNPNFLFIKCQKLA